MRLFYMRNRAATRRFQIENRWVCFVAGQARNRFYFGSLLITRQDACLDRNDFTAGFPPLSRLYQMQLISCWEDRIHRSGASAPTRYPHVASRTLVSTVAAGPAGGQNAGFWRLEIIVLNKRLPAGQNPPQNGGSRRAWVRQETRARPAPAKPLILFRT